MTAPRSPPGPAQQVVFLDTPGIISDKRNKLEERMMASVQEAVKDADALLAIVDVSNQPREALQMIQPGEDWRGPPMAVVREEAWERQVAVAWAACNPSRLQVAEEGSPSLLQR